MEYFTVLNNIIGGTNQAFGTIDFEIISSNKPKPTSSSPTSNPNSCTWIGHCLNDPCKTYNDWYKLLLSINSFFFLFYLFLFTVMEIWIA